MAQRIKGQEVEFILLIDGEPQPALKFAQKIDFAFQTEMTNEGYIGETTERYDTIFNGVKGSTDHHMDDPTPFIVTRAIVDKARRRTPGTQFNLRATLNYPGGQRARIVFRDCEFGELPFSAGSRKDFISFSLDFACSEAQVLPL